MSPKIYLTTTLPYVNAEPHLGFALELVQADAAARLARLAGREVFFNTGTDEHGLKVFRAAAKEGIPPAQYAARAAAKFRRLLPALGLWPEINFIRTTDRHHAAAAQEFWRRAAAAGDIYKKKYQVKYCVGCELEKTESELTAGRCPLHPNQDLELIAEENYFFRFSKYQKPLLELYAARPDFVIPASRLNEVREFVSRGLEDFSISRLAVKQPWGIPVPDDLSQTMYVWFDALVNYISAIGWPASAEATAGKPGRFWDWWPPARPNGRSGGVIQFAGKDNLRQQAAMWPAMLLSVGLPPSRQVVIHGFITSAGQKMSKSLGNVIDPFALIAEYGADAVRYYLLRHVQPFEDSDFTLEKFKKVYNANLANGLGNLVSRVLTLSRVTLDIKRVVLKSSKDYPWNEWNYEFNRALDSIWQKISESDGYIQKTQPFLTIRTDPTRAQNDLEHLVGELWQIAGWLTPFMPQTAATIIDLIRQNRAPTQPLFPRK